MKINIIRTEDSWVIGQITNAYARLLPNCTLHAPGFTGAPGDINLYITYAAYRGRTTGIDIGWFTHRELASPRLFDTVASQVDLCIAMSRRTAAVLPPDRTVVIEPGIDRQFNRSEITFGCVGREYTHTSRKKFDWLERLKQIPRAKFFFTNQRVPWEQMPQFYRSVDYLLVLSDNEGGPMTVPEALACGTPVIAPDVGWCWEYPVLRYNGLEELDGIIRKLTIPPDTEQTSAAKLVRLFTALTTKASNESAQ
jgi:hypothetical protein